MSEFKHIKIRVGALIRHEDQIALIHRNKNGQDSYTLPGGNVEDGEDIHKALHRELIEELNINPKNQQLVAIQDQIVSRPGNTPAPRKLHFIFMCVIDTETKFLMADIETDDLGQGNIVWINLASAVSLHLYPAINPLLTTGSMFETAKLALLPPMTDDNFIWR